MFMITPAIVNSLGKCTCVFINQLGCLIVKPVIVKPIDKKKDKIIKPIDPQSFKSIEEEEIKKPVAKPNNGLVKPVSPIGVKKIDSKKFKN